MHSFGAFEPEALKEMGEILDTAFEKLQGTGEPDVVRELIAVRIIAVARLGERDPARLLEAALQGGANEDGNTSGATSFCKTSRNS